MHSHKAQYLDNFSGGCFGDHCIWPGNKLKSNEFKLSIMIHILDFERSAY